MGSKKILENSGLKVKTTEEAMKDREELKTSAFLQSIKPYSPMRPGTKVAAVKAGLVPEAYMNCEFDTDKIADNQRAQNRVSNRRFVIKRFDDYKNVTLGIIATILSNKLPNQSYVIGAPNGFGKTSFVNSCIMAMYGQGRQKVTPYISLMDLAQVKVANDKRLLGGVTSKSIYRPSWDDAYNSEEYIKSFYDKFDEETYVKKPINIIDQFSWSEYMNCDVLFCYFTDITSKVLESEIFKTAITIRGTKGLPTIAMISTSLDPYKNDKNLGEFVWNEILAYDSAEPSYDRVKHVSCYKDYNAPLKTISKE